MSDFDNVHLATPELRDVSSLEKYENNAKKHPKEQIQGIVSSIKEFGWRANPIEITETGLVVNGHGRLMAAEHLGLKQVPVAVIEGLSDSEVRAYRLAHNRVAEGGNDSDILTLEISELMGDGMDMSLFFTDKELAYSMEDMGEMNFDAISTDLSSEMDAIAGDTQDYIDDEDDDSKLSLARTVGYSKVNTGQQRIIRRFQMHSEEETGKKGAAALSEYMEKLLGG